ncbi:MAG: hypothetical protein M3R21_07705 [Candidatus Dormibacteraeota bacterium]|nr:hypothetical protein [Candidatus Dormibacteraeota bacterium]
MDLEGANSARCRGRAGTYEAWYVTVVEPARRQGYWFRYTTFNPAPGVETDAHSALWAFRFDHEDPGANWGAKASFPLAALQVQSRPFALRLDDALLVDNGCSGEIDTERGKMTWDLRWDSREHPFPFLRSPWHLLSSVANIGVQPAIKVSGTIVLNGKPMQLEHAPGGQQHTWGSRHALEWNWGFASGDDFWIDGATSRVRSLLGKELVGTALGAHAREHRFLLNGPLQVLATRGPMAAESWNAQAKLGPRQLHVEVRPRRSDLIGVTYPDPRGGSRVCYHTEVADLEMRLTHGEEVLARIRRPAAAAFEYAAESPVSGLPVLF